ncbi:MAG: LiaI-LiaF-like domain-containing protein [Omnitrophica WOR_2 bacterium]|jgi:predicted membrane protein
MENQSNQVQKHVQSYKATVLGVILILFGGLYFMHQANMLDPRLWHVIFSWQMLLIAFGVLALSEKNYGWGTTLIVVGGMFLYKRYTGHPIDYFWPILIIIAGLAILFVRPRYWNQTNSGQSKEGISEGDVLNETAIFGGNDRIIRTENFKGGTVVSIFGGSKIDLTQANIQPGNTIYMGISSIFGGSTLIVPPDWNTKLEVTSILGGFSDKRYNVNVDKSKTLVIRGICIFGGGELKS